MDFAPPTETPVEQNNILPFPARARGGVSQIMTHGCWINPPLSILQINSICPALLSGVENIEPEGFEKANCYLVEAL